MIQSLENFVSMAIQGTQVPMYTKHTMFLYFQILSQSGFYALLCFVFLIKKIEKLEKYKNIVCFVYIGTCEPWMEIETKFSKFCISCSLDEYLYAQLSK